MKRLITMLLLLIFASLACCAYAEDNFVLRNGIQFGDTMDEVRKKETALWDEEDCDEDTLKTNNATAAGFSGVEIMYSFDTEGKLISVLWHLDSRSDASLSDVDYEKLYKAFVSKYGSPLGYESGDCYIYTGDALNAAIHSIALCEYFDGVGDLRDYDEWDVEYGHGEHVKIEIAQYYAGLSYSERDYYISISYNCFTDSELDDLQNEKQQERDAIINDI